MTSNIEDISKIIEQDEILAVLDCGSELKGVIVLKFKTKCMMLLLGAVLTSSICMTGCSRNSKTFESPHQNKKSTNITVQNDDIENSPPVKLLVAAKDSESGKDQYVTDLEEVLKRYNAVDKSKLTYEAKMVGDHKDTYFYEFNNGLALHRKDNADLKPINDKTYEKMLLGYSYNSVENTLSKDDALRKISLVLPDDVVQTESNTYDSEEVIHFNSSKGEFLVTLGFAYSSEENDSNGYNKDQVMYINYFKQQS